MDSGQENAGMTLAGFVISKRQRDLGGAALLFVIPKVFYTVILKLLQCNVQGALNRHSRIVLSGI